MGVERRRIEVDSRQGVGPIPYTGGSRTAEAKATNVNMIDWRYSRDIEAIEQVQRRFTERLAGLKKLSYGQRLKLKKLAKP